MKIKDILYLTLPTVISVAVLVIIVAVALLFKGGEESYRSIRVVELKGDVSIDREGLGNLEAAVNMNLISGDRISTSKDAYVVLQLDEDKYVMLGEQGAIQVFAFGKAADGRTQIHLETGTIVNDIQNALSQNSSYEIIIPGVAMSVRGTVFEARWCPDDGTGELLVYEGSVDLTLQGKDPVLYSHGEYAQFEAGDTPKFLIEHETITDERMDLQMIPFLYQIIVSGRVLDFGSATISLHLTTPNGQEGNWDGYDWQGSDWNDDQHDEASGTATSLSMAALGLEDHVMDWQDENLEAFMRKTTGIMDRDIMLSDVWELSSLEMEAKNASTITNISALSELTNLTELELPCGLQDISPLSSLTNLQYLYLENNQISDFSALSNLTNLRSLTLYNNHISDISALSSALSGLTNLKSLNLSINQISDISALSGLVNLEQLQLGSNQISDISALSNLTNLKRLDLYSNQISDISALSGLVKLEQIYLNSNQISDINALSGITKLTFLELKENQISDISALSGMINLKQLYLSSNQISDIRVLSNLTNLTSLNLEENPIIDYSVVEFVEQNGGHVSY